MATGRKRKDPNFTEGTFLIFPDEFKIDPIQIDDFMNIEVGYTQNNGHRQKTRGVLRLRDIVKKYS